MDHELTFLVCQRLPACIVISKPKKVFGIVVLLFHIFFSVEWCIGLLLIK